MGYYTRFNLTVSKVAGIDPIAQKLEQLKSKIVENIEPTKIVEELAKIQEFMGQRAHGDTLTPDIIINALRSDCEQASWALDETGSSYESTKWYSHKEDLLKFSKKYPEWLFTLKGEGEESGDIWKLYVLDGKYQHSAATLVFEEFDPNKLETL